MKKVLSTAAALGLATGIAATASAAEFSASGFYSVEGYYLTSANGAGADLILRANEDRSDAYYMHSFTINPVMKVNDNITMKSEIRLADYNIWGNQAGGDTNANRLVASTLSTTATGAHTHTVSVNAGTAGRRDIDIYKLYMEYQSPIGKFRVGRVDSKYGTDFLGYGSADRIMFWPKDLLPKPFGTLFFLQKSTEGDGTGAANNTADADSDFYEARLTYGGDNLKGSICYDFSDVATTANQDLTRSRFRGMGSFGYGNLNFIAEWSYDWGQIEPDTGVTATGATAANIDMDIQTLAFLGLVTTKMGNMDLAGAYVYASGDNSNIDNENNAALGNATEGGSPYATTGEDFQPAYIMTGREAGVFNTVGSVGAANTSGAVRRSGLHALHLSANYHVDAKMTVHGAITAGWADEAPTVGGGTAAVTDWDDDYGWELDLGLSYKLLDNLTYDLHFGYWDVGDYAAMGLNAAQMATSGISINDITMVSNHLTMTF